MLLCYILSLLLYVNKSADVSVKYDEFGGMSCELTYRSNTIPYLHNEAAVQRVLIYTHRCADKENGKENGKENVRQCSINKQLFQTTSALLYKQCIL